MNKNTLWTILLSAIFICASQPSYGSILIGRITHVEGKVLTYSEDEEDWVEAGANTPAGAEDGFYTEEDSKAELVFPNDTMLRIGEVTEVEVLRIDEESTEVYIRTGIVRAYSRSPDTVMKVGTAMGYVEIPPQGIVDFFVDDRSTEVVPIQEDIVFHKTVGAGAPEIHQLRAGSNSLIFSLRHVETGTALADTPWNRWCLNRDMILREQAAIRSAHLPSSLQVYSHELEPYGEWEMMEYLGYNYWFWRPVRVSIGWTPFTRGCWNRWHREYVWVSTEPWGWCTYHYGDWINLHGAWWWTPYIHMGVSFPGISLVNLHIRFGPLFKPFWHPGRIAWVSTTSHVGWIPLAPWETYYGCRKWGPRTVVVNYGDRPKSRERIDHYAYREHSVMVPQKEFRRVSPNRNHDYRKFMVTGIDKKTLLRDSKPTYGHHKMAELKQNPRKAKSGTAAKGEKINTKPNAFRSSIPPARVSKEGPLLTPEEKRTFPRKQTGDRVTNIAKKPPMTSSNPKSGAKKSPQYSTPRPPQKPLTKQDYPTQQNLRQTRPNQYPRQSSTLPPAQHIDKNTPPSRSGLAMKSQPLKNPQKLATQDSRQKRGAMSQSGTPMEVSKGKASTPEKRTTPPQVSTARPPRKPLIEQESHTRQSLKQTRPEQSTRPSSTFQRAQPIEKNTVPSGSGQSMKSQPSRNPQKWASQQSRQQSRETGSNTTPRQRRE